MSKHNPTLQEFLSGKYELLVPDLYDEDLIAFRYLHRRADNAGKFAMRDVRSGVITFSDLLYTEEQAEELYDKVTPKKPRYET